MERSVPYQKKSWKDPFTHDAVATKNALPLAMDMDTVFAGLPAFHSKVNGPMRKLVIFCDMLK